MLPERFASNVKNLKTFFLDEIYSNVSRVFHRARFIQEKTSAPITSTFDTSRNFKDSKLVESFKNFKNRITFGVHLKHSRACCCVNACSRFSLLPMHL